LHYLLSSSISGVHFLANNQNGSPLPLYTTSNPIVVEAMI
jgi:hypothetical protein